jgi:branched-subunit amino acid transport protein
MPKIGFFRKKPTPSITAAAATVAVGYATKSPIWGILAGFFTFVGVGALT